MPQNRFLANCQYECTNMDTGYHTIDCDLEAAEHYALEQAEKGHELSTWLVDPFGNRLYEVNHFCVTLH